MTAVSESERVSREARGSRTSRLVTSALVAGACAALALAGCSAGQMTQTATQVAAVPGVNVNAGTIALRNLVIGYNDPGGYPVGSNAPLEVRIFNEGVTAVTLVGASADKATAVSLVGPPEPVVTPAPASPLPATSESPSPSAAPTGSPAASPADSASPSVPASPSASPSAPAPASSPISIQIPPQSYAALVPGEGAYLQLTGLKEAVVPGGWVTVTFTFDNGVSVPVQIPLAPQPAMIVPRATSVVPAGEEGHE